MISAYPGLFLPIGLWLLWVLGLYALLTIIRLQQMAGRSGLEAVEARASANLSNQFEAPLLLLAGVILLLMEKAVTPAVEIWLWVFLLGRIVHSVVQISQPRIIPRGLVFSINFAAVFAIWLLLASHVLGGGV